MDKRDGKGRFLKGHAGYHSNRGTSEARILAEMAQRDFVRSYFDLLKKTPKDLEALAKNPDTPNYMRVPAKFIFNCISKGDINHLKAYLKLLGIDISDPSLNINMHESRLTEGSTDEGGEVIDVPHGTISPTSIVEAIKRDPLLSDAIDVKIKDSDDEK